MLGVAGHVIGPGWPFTLAVRVAPAEAESWRRLAPGLEAEAALKATDVMIERGNRRADAHDDEGLARYSKQVVL